MKDRIKQIMDNEHLTPSAFADRLQIGRAVISHILNGRNNPSLEIVTRILTRIDKINPDWLLTGNGNMYKTDQSEPKISGERNSLENYSKTEPDLFAQTSLNVMNPPIDKEEIIYRKENIVNQSPNILEEPIKQQIIYQKSPEKKISKIIIYYTDNTFEAFNVENKPL